MSARSRKARDAIKRDSPWPGQTQPFIQYAIERLQSEVDQGALPGFFGAGVELVPAPRSAPLTKGALWPGRRICQELERNGLGGPVLDLLERREPVQKAAFAGVMGGERPTVTDHLTTLACSRPLLLPARLLVVDDVVTSGSMLLAAASHLRETFPNAEVKAFALLRTMSAGEVEQVLLPCAGLITYEGWGHVRREP